MYRYAFICLQSTHSLSISINDHGKCRQKVEKIELLSDKVYLSQAKSNLKMNFSAHFVLQWFVRAGTYFDHDRVNLKRFHIPHRNCYRASSKRSVNTKF